MFGKNAATPPKYFEDQQPGTLMVTSMFYTLQGEGPYAGRPAVFIRLAKCNLQCSFCDTYFEAGDSLQFNAINLRIAKVVADFYSSLKLAAPDAAKCARNYPGDRLLLVITGGEPFLQPNLGAFLDFAQKCGYDTQIESNGNFYQYIPHETMLVISPKINERTGKHIKLHEAALDRAEVLKFVVAPDVPGYEDIPEFALRWYQQAPTYRYLYVSPMNCYAKQPAMPTDPQSIEARTNSEKVSFWTPGLLDLERNRRNHEHAALIAMKHGATLTLQMHLYASLA